MTQLYKPNTVVWEYHSPCLNGSSMLIWRGTLVHGSDSGRRLFLPQPAMENGILNIWLHNELHVYMRFNSLPDSAFLSHTQIRHNENRHKSSGGHRTSRSRTCSAPFSSSTLSWRCSTPADRCSTSVTDWLAVDSVSSFTWDRSCVICLSCSHTCFCSSSLSCISSYQQMTQPFTITEWQWRRKVVHVDNH